MPDVVGLLPGLAQTVVYIAVIIVLAGLVSGIVAVGLMQIFGRAIIQQRVLRRFFRDRPHPHWDPMRFERFPPTESMILDMPEPLLCRLYYRQITGQLLAAANAEAARGFGEETPVLDALALIRKKEGPPAPPEEPSVRLHKASRTIDILQAELGEASANVVSVSLMAVWTLVYLWAGTLAALEEPAKSRPFVLIGVVIIGGLLAACSSAVGLAAFNWLERISAPR
jgi:hypothetical protein